MYAFIEGEVCEKSAGELVILAGGVGYRILCSASTLQAAPPVGGRMRCYTILSVREDAIELCGFATQEERRMYRQLINISGVGPKMALAILGSMPLRELNLAILLENTAAISRAPGVGKKTAQRIVLELKEKIDPGTVNVPGEAPQPIVAEAADSVAEALEALVALGYSSTEARTALARVRDTNGTADELIRAALRSMAGV